MLWTVWVEGGSFQTAGGTFNIPSLPGLGAPYAPFSNLPGLEGAFGFDYRWAPDSPWHFVFDFRYGRNRTATSSSSTSSSTGPTTTTTTTHSTHVISPYTSVLQAIVRSTTNSGSSSSATQASDWESHWVADFMIGRDLGMGSSSPQIQLGIRVADLSIAGSATESGLTTSTVTKGTTTTRTKSVYGTFYTPTVTTKGPTTVATAIASSSSASWNSCFFGAGPRAAFTGSQPIVGFWTFDYGTGIALLFGERCFKASGVAAGGSFSLTSNSYAAVVNNDGWAALSYWFTPHAKLSAGIRADFYASALTTYNINTGALETIDRAYWGPFVRLTAVF